MIVEREADLSAAPNQNQLRQLAGIAQRRTAAGRYGIENEYGIAGLYAIWYICIYMIEQKPKLSSQEVFDKVGTHLARLRSELTQPVRVREEELAEQLGVSRTPVREALIRLNSTGLISLRPGKGALLQPVTDAEYFEWLQVREQIEGLAAREAALNASQRDVDGLRAILEPFYAGEDVSSDGADYARANVLFHEQIIRLSGNSLLIRLWESFGHLKTSYRRKTIQRLHRQSDSLAEHASIIDAIERRAAAEAERLAKAHVSLLAAALRKSIKEGP